jgi:hypothetical protein
LKKVGIVLLIAGVVLLLVSFLIPTEEKTETKIVTADKEESEDKPDSNVTIVKTETDPYERAEFSPAITQD